MHPVVGNSTKLLLSQKFSSFSHCAACCGYCSAPNLARRRALQGGQSIHTSPSAHVADCGSLLQSAGFSLPTVDQDTVLVGYPNAFVLMEHLQVH